MNAWIEGISIDEIEKNHSSNVFSSISPGDIRSLADVTRFNIKSVYQIIAVILEGNCPKEEELEILLRRLETGIPISIIDLLKLPSTLLERGDYLELSNAGINSVKDYWKKDPEVLKKIIGHKGVLLEAERPKL